MKILFIGDIVGRRARRVVTQKIAEIKAKQSIDFVIANVENASNGVGITEKSYMELLDAGVDGMTSGNHIWDKKDFIERLDEPSCVVVRPANYPSGVPGVGYKLITKNDQQLLYISLMGRVFVGPNLDDPFRVIDNILKENKDIKNIFVDFHAEATSEKAVMGHYLDGRISAMVGTHTHIQTNDARVLPKSTGFISDVGMVGALNSSLGVNYEDVLMKEKMQIPVTFSLPIEGPMVFCAVILELDDSGKCISIKPIYEIVELGGEND